jgi:hypothetical protein
MKKLTKFNLESLIKNQSEDHKQYILSLSKEISDKQKQLNSLIISIQQQKNKQLDDF